MTTERDPRWPPCWRTDHKEIAAELEAAGWRIYRKRPVRDLYLRIPKEDFDFILWPTHRFETITPGARHALNAVVMGRSAPQRTVDEEAS